MIIDLEDEEELAAFELTDATMRSNSQDEEGSYEIPEDQPAFAYFEMEEDVQQERPGASWANPIIIDSDDEWNDLNNFQT